MLTGGLGPVAADGGEWAEPPVDRILDLPHAGGDAAAGDRGLGPELGNEGLDAVLLAGQCRDQPAQSPDPDLRGPLGALLGCHEPLQRLLLEAALAAQVFQDRRVLQNPLRVVIAQYRDLRSLRAAHVSGRGERREFPARLAELTAQD